MRAVRVHSPNSASGCDRSYRYVPSIFRFIQSPPRRPPALSCPLFLSLSLSLFLSPSPSLSLLFPFLSPFSFFFRLSRWRARARKARQTRPTPFAECEPSNDLRTHRSFLPRFVGRPRPTRNLPVRTPGEPVVVLCAGSRRYADKQPESDFAAPTDRGYGFRRCSRGRGTAEATSEQIRHKSVRKMQAAPPLLSILLLLFANNVQQALGLCNLENGTSAKCHELEDVKYIETYDLESLKSSVADGVLGPGLFTNLSTLRHLDLSGGNLKRIEPGSLLNLRDLKSLDLSDNQLEYLELAALDGLHQLRSLNLERNDLRQLPPALVRLKNLRHLDVQGNQFQCNCATLRVRDLLLKRGVKMLKKVACAGPRNMKGVLILKPEANVVCLLEEQDKEMQRDEPREGSGDEADPWDSLSPDEFEDLTEDHEPSTKSEEHSEIETPAPEQSHTTESARSNSAAVETSKASKETSSGEKATEDDGELFFDTDDRKPSTTTQMSKQEVKDALFYPVEGSGDEEEEGSGTEGSGAGIGWPHLQEETGATSVEPSTTAGSSLFDLFFDVFWSTTAAPEVQKDPDLEEEQFIDASSTKLPVHEETVVSRKIIPDEAPIVPHTSPATSTSSTANPDVGLIESSEINDMSKSGKVQADDESSDEMASPARQSKKGMGSYVVLAALLAVLAALIGFAAYKGDFCRKKRKRNDVETGTELKDMQKALLEGGGTTQPKIASNGNMENVPLVDGAPEEDTKEKSSKDICDAPRSLNGASDPVKPPRKTYSSHDEPKFDEELKIDTGSVKDGSLSSRTSPCEPGMASTASDSGATPKSLESNGPQLSPGAQRVKITLQENPDSVPKTPILITRTMGGENLVKTP